MMAFWMQLAIATVHGPFCCSCLKLHACMQLYSFYTKAIAVAATIVIATDYLSQCRSSWSWFIAIAGGNKCAAVLVYIERQLDWLTDGLSRLNLAQLILTLHGLWLTAKEMGERNCHHHHHVHDRKILF